MADAAEHGEAGGRELEPVVGAGEGEVAGGERELLVAAVEGERAAGGDDEGGARRVVAAVGAGAEDLEIEVAAAQRGGREVGLPDARLLVEVDGGEGLARGLEQAGGPGGVVAAGEEVDALVADVADAAVAEYVAALSARIAKAGIPA